MAAGMALVPADRRGEGATVRRRAPHRPAMQPQSAAVGLLPSGPGEAGDTDHLAAFCLEVEVVDLQASELPDV